MKNLEQMTTAEIYSMGSVIAREFKEHPELYVACPYDALEEMADRLGYPLQIVQLYFFATVQGNNEGYTQGHADGYNEGYNEASKLSWD